ncbi:MAG: PQQ-dependent dehydrogenase, methanol/ethanol family [Gammaproteobacteria bacterium]|nr:PQQ-dependent dehydrogenase, methanol/ethanol family [Gammaproteobacteria bacterium]
MAKLKFHHLGVAAVIGCLPFASVQAGEVPNYRDVSQERLEDPEPHNWLMYRGNYEGWGYSPLAEINSGNVDTLRPVWTFSTGVTEGHQSPPIVNDGVMFITTPQNQVFALDARTGEQYWRYQREIPEELFQLHPTNRGVGLYEDKVFVATTDAFLVALEAKTGKVLWETAVEDYKTGYYLTLAPLTVDGLAIVGVSGGEYGIRGFVAAYDVDSGKEVWKRHTIPGPGEPGHDTWEGDTWKTGGASAWITGTYDPDTKILYWGIGNAAPWMPDNRAGDNLYANSVIAINVDTGELVGHHQYHWNEAWDWDEVSAPILMPVKRGNKTLKALVHPARNGYLWVLEPRANGTIGFVDAEPYVRQDVFTSIDGNTGRPTYHPDRIPGIGRKADFCPSLWGGKDWPPAAYNPQTGLLYIPANDNLCGHLTGKAEEYKPGQLYLTTAIADIGLTIFPGSDHIGEIQAWNMDSRTEQWTHNFEFHNWGPILTTGGNLVFAGGTNDRYFRAFDATSGEVLWQFKTNSGVAAVPSTFEVNGVQYVAVQSGWGVDPQRVQGAIDGQLGTKTEVPQGGVVWVFALDR